MIKPSELDIGLQRAVRPSAGMPAVDRQPVAQHRAAVGWLPPERSEGTTVEHLAVLVALGFASARVTQLVVHDSLLDGWRQRLELWHARKFDSSIRTFIRDLVKCLYCVGFHASWLTVLTYLLATGANPVGSFGSFVLFGIQSFAVAGVAMLVNRYDDSLSS